MTSFMRTTSTYKQGATTLPREYYTSATLLEEETERLFWNAWLCVGRAERLAEPGAYLLHERFGESVIVVHARSGEIRAFYNVCRHRGTKICEAATGQFSETIQCPYHAWTWTTDGRLIGAPHMHEVEGFDKASHPLHSLPVHVWQGFVFVSYGSSPPPFEEAFAPVLGRYERFRLPELRTVERIEYDVKANWKLIMQNYNECLHCPTIHPELNQLLPYTSGANDLHDGPFLGGYMEITEPNVSVTMSGRSCGVPLPSMEGADARRAFYYSLWPNMMLSLHPDYANWYSVWPVAPDRSIVTCEWMMNPSGESAEGYNPKDAVDLWHTVNQQDWHICELSQAGVSSRMYRPGPYSPRESIPAAWDRAYLEAMGGVGRA